MQQQSTGADAPLFDSARAAMRFAMNNRLAMPSPLMNRMMADGKVMRLELADGSRITVAAPKGPPRSCALRGLDGAATAGILLAHLARLPDEQQLVVMAATALPQLPCACRQPCCMGAKPNPDWARAVARICEYLRDEAQLSRIKGKKGMSTSPLMRQLLVEKYFQPSRVLILSALAERCDVTEQTVIAHRRPIITFLDKQEAAAWRALDESLGAAGIVGFVP